MSGFSLLSILLTVQMSTHVTAFTPPSTIGILQAVFHAMLDRIHISEPLADFSPTRVDYDLPSAPITATATMTKTAVRTIYNGDGILVNFSLTQTDLLLLFFLLCQLLLVILACSCVCYRIGCKNGQKRAGKQEDGRERLGDRYLMTTEYAEVMYNRMKHFQQTHLKEIVADIVAQRLAQRPPQRLSTVLPAQSVQSTAPVISISASRPQIESRDISTQTDAPALKPVWTQTRTAAYTNTSTQTELAEAEHTSAVTTNVADASTQTHAAPITETSRPLATLRYIDNSTGTKLPATVDAATQTAAPSEVQSIGGDPPSVEITTGAELDNSTAPRPVEMGTDDYLIFQIEQAATIETAPSVGGERRRRMRANERQRRRRQQARRQQDAGGEATDEASPTDLPEAVIANDEAVSEQANVTAPIVLFPSELSFDGTSVEQSLNPTRSTSLSAEIETGTHEPANEEPETSMTGNTDATTTTLQEHIFTNSIPRFANIPQLFADDASRPDVSGSKFADPAATSAISSSQARNPFELPARPERPTPPQQDQSQMPFGRRPPLTPKSPQRSLQASRFARK